MPTHLTIESDFFTDLLHPWHAAWKPMGKIYDFGDLLQHLLVSWLLTNFLLMLNFIIVEHFMVCPFWLILKCIIGLEYMTKKNYLTFFILFLLIFLSFKYFEAIFYNNIIYIAEETRCLYYLYMVFIWSLPLASSLSLLTIK